jgi:ubiquinone/menaquinone biosynthesis C-methylase UbiE
MSDGISKEILGLYHERYFPGGAEHRKAPAVDIVKNVVALCRDLDPKRILDIGAGEGSVLKRLSDVKFGEKLFGLEISQSFVENIKNREISNLADCKVYDGYSVPYPDNCFDIVILSHVVEHLEHPRTLLAEASRVSKFVYVEVPLEDNVRLNMKNADHFSKSTGHINFFSEKTIKLLIKTSGLDIAAVLITNPSLQVYVAQGKKRYKYFIKEAALTVFPKRIATKLFTYHCSILCKRA